MDDPTLATPIDGAASAARLRERLRAAVEALRAAHGLAPGLAVVRVGDDPASEVYVRTKVRHAAEAGFVSREIHLPADVAEATLVERVQALNQDPAVHGMLVQLPLPAAIDADRVVAAIDPGKDVDGLHPVNQGHLVAGRDGLVPCTPLGCMILLRETLGTLAGAGAVVVGRSRIVGLPLALLLLRDDCTVTVAHSRSRDLAGLCRGADILVAAVGRPALVRGDWVRPGATVIDVGINRVEVAGKRRLVGDVAYDEALRVAGAITPVPGGVRPMTVACVLANTLKAACRQRGLPVPAAAALP